MSKNEVCLTSLAVAAVAALVTVSCASGPRPEPLTPSTGISLEEARKTVITEVAKPSKAPYGLRVHMYPELLQKGSRVVPYDLWVRGEREFIVCGGDCWFFWFDDDPLAQFAHATRYVLVDASTGKVTIKETEWWPVVGEKVVWGTTKERASSRSLVFEKPSKLNLSLDRKHRFTIREPQAIPGCEEWVILICGSDDVGNTFDEDVRYLYSVFTGFGHDDAHIFYISPWTTDAGVDRTTTIANVQWAINQVAINSDAEDKVFFFYSSHGGVDFLHCRPGVIGGGNVTSGDMDNWLDTITARDMVILLQGCHTGSFIGYYSDGTVVGAENELTGDGETNRIAITATDTTHSSYGGASTWGSTFTGGYVEAFNDATADVDSDGGISVNEAYTYAEDHDSAASSGWSFPHMDPTSLDPDEVFHPCPEVDVWISDGSHDNGGNSYDYDSLDIWSSLSPTGMSHENPVVGLTNYVHVRVHNLGSTASGNVDASLYWANTGTALAWPADFHQIGTVSGMGSIAAGGHAEHIWPWYVDPAFGTGHHFCFVATSDSPGDPLSGGPPGCTYVAPYDNNIAQKNVTIVDTQAGQSAFVSFLIENNVRMRMVFDLVIRRENFPEGELILFLPDDLMKIVQSNDDVLNGLKLVDDREGGKPCLLVTAARRATIRGIALKPMETREVSLEIIAPKAAKAGEEFTIRIEEVANQEVIGANNFLVRIVSPGDCRSTMKGAAEVYAQIAREHPSETALKLVRMIGDGLQKGLCVDHKRALKWKRMAFELEKALGDELEGQVPRKALDAYRGSLRLLESALERGDVEEVMIAQRGAVDAASELVSTK